MTGSIALHGLDAIILGYWGACFPGEERLTMWCSISFGGASVLGFQSMDGSWTGWKFNFLGLFWRKIFSSSSILSN